MTPPCDSLGQFLYEESVSHAGFPLVETVSDLLCSGDRLVSLELCLCPITTHLLSLPMPLSDAIASLRNIYTQADIENALSGSALLSRALLLSHVAAFQRESEAVSPVPPLVPPLEIEPIVARERWEGAAEGVAAALAAVEERRAAAKSRGCVVRYAATIGPEGISVRLQEYDEGHAFAMGEGWGVAVAIVTGRAPTPVVVCQRARVEKGVPATLAANLTGDLIRLRRMLVADDA